MRLAYVCRAGGNFGWGHFHRGVALLERLDNTSNLVVGSGFEEASANKSGFSLRRWQSPEEPIDPSKYDLAIIDDYSVSADWLAHTADKIPTYVVDDWMRSSARVTGFINPNIGAERLDYDGVEAQQWLLGEKFAFMRREACELASSPRVQHFSNHVLVTLGGSDPDGRTAELVDELLASDWYRKGGRLTVVLGPSYDANVPSGPDGANSFEILRNPPDYLRRCRSADLVVCSASTVSHEMALLGVPFVPLAFVDNQKRIVECWKRVGIGAGFDADHSGWPRAVAAYVADATGSPDRLREMSARGKALVDGEGTSRVVYSCREILGT